MRRYYPCDCPPDAKRGERCTRDIARCQPRMEHFVAEWRANHPAEAAAMDQWQALARGACVVVVGLVKAWQAEELDWYAEASAWQSYWDID